MMEKDTINTLEFKRRREIYEYVVQNSGLHMRDISRKINIPLTSLQYHLNYLEKKGLIISREDGKYNRYFISLENGEEEKKILNCLRKRTSLHIILWFFIAQQCSQRDLSRYLNKHPATIGFHLHSMLHAGIIEQVQINDGVIYKDTPPSIIKRSQVSSEKIYILKDPWILYNLLIKHKENLGDKKTVVAMIEYIEFFITEGIPKQVQNLDEIIESVVDTFCGFFFPLSFCS